MNDPGARGGGRPITTSTRTFALLGDPVAHSLSPVLQNAACTAAGVDAVYVAIRCDSEGLPGLLTGLARAGGGGNVTLPHKGDAAGLLDQPTEAVRRTGACNTFWAEDGAIHGDNTDVEGFRRAVESAFPGPQVGKRVLLVGAGGAARAILVALMDLGVREVSVVNRSPERARAMSRRIGGERVRVLGSMREVEGEPYDLVVNATSVGLHPGDPVFLELSALGSVGGVMDIVYGHEGTALLARARECGIPACDGRGMLLHQGAVAFERWTGLPAPLEAMERALAEAL